MSTGPAYAWLNGELLPYAEARIPLSDRGVLLGDSFFESVAVLHGQPFALAEHLDRLARGIRFAGFQHAPDAGVLRLAAEAVLKAEMAAGAPPHGTLRFTVTRGPGRRGYSPRGTGPATAFVVFHPGDEPCAPHPGWRLRTSAFRIPHGDLLAAFKHGSRMLHVLARAEAEAHGADEALLLNTRGEPAECASGNLLWFEGDALRHAAGDSGALAGVTQDIVLRLAAGRGMASGPPTGRVAIQDALAVGGGMVVLSTLGVVPILSIDGRACPQREETRWLAGALRARAMSSTTDA